MERSEGTTLKGHAHTLTPFIPEDVSDQYVGWLNDPEVTRHFEKRQVHQNLETAQAYVSSFYGYEKRYIWGICPNGPCTPVGTIILSDINHVSGSAGFGVTIGEAAYRGTGAASEAIDLVARFAFQTIKLHRLWATTAATNYGMLFTFKQLGFTLEGQLRKACLLGDGTHVDLLLWGLLAEEWKPREEHGH